MDYHHLNVRELDLSASYPDSFADRINYAVPGLRTSTAFFSFLRANLVLSHSAVYSCANTPNLDPTYTHYYTPPSPSSFSSSSSSFSSSSSPSSTPLIPLDDIPPFSLSLEPLDTPDLQSQGLNLIADSIAQMRQSSSKSLLSHPISLAALSIALILTHKFTTDPATGLMLSCAVVMAYLMTIRWLTDGYLRLASTMDYSTWLYSNNNGDQDILLGARYQNVIVGALVLRLSSTTTNNNNNNNNRRKSRGDRLRGGKGIIRAWTTALRYRGQGIGRDMLLHAVRLTRDKCGREAEIGFAKEHANSTMLLPAVFNQSFRRDEVRATKALREAISEWEVSKRKR